jgi:hypothetical protein
VAEKAMGNFELYNMGERILQYLTRCNSYRVMNIDIPAEGLITHPTIRVLSQPGGKTLHSALGHAVVGLAELS